MRTRIKICGITTRDTLHACIDLGIDAVGFVFADSPRRIDPAAARSLIDRLPSFITSVGVFKGATEPEILLSVHHSGIAVVQTEADELAGFTTPIPRALPVFRTGNDLSTAHSHPAPLILIEGPRSGSGLAADWSLIEPIARRRPIILAGGLTAANVADAIRRIRPFAVDVSSGVESSPGVKDPRLIRDFVRAVHNADRSIDGDNP